MGPFNFDQQVVKRSFEIPVLVDFWAPWCGPCRVLGPVIEQLARENNGRWELVKVNTEEEEELAQRFRIQSIPNVKLFYRGEVIGEFMGALPRTSIERWLAEYLPDERRQTLQALLADLELDVDPEAMNRLLDFARENPDMKEASLIAARLLVFSDPAQAVELVASIHLGDKLHEAAEDVRQLAELLHFEDQSEHPAAQKLTAARDALRQEEAETAIKLLIEATQLDKQYHRELPRKASIALFRILGDKHPLTKQYRKRFDMVLY